MSKACLIFQLSQTCYRYKAQLDEQNKMIADWLLKLTNENKTWGFQLCFLYLRNVKGYSWNHKRVYRIYKELELNHERPHMSVDGKPPKFKQ